MIRFCIRQASTTLVQSKRLESTSNNEISNLLKKTLDANRNVKVVENAQAWKEQLHPLKRKGGKVRMKMKKDNMKSHFIPITSTAFSKFSLNSSLCQRLNSQFSATLPVQDGVLLHALSNRNVIMQWETGSGKTLAYAIPVVNALLNKQLTHNRRCLVIAPTKELANQIHGVFLGLLPKASSVILLGAAGKKNTVLQNKTLIGGVPIIIATPAALNAKLKLGVLKLADVSKLVIDEFDRLFQPDFENQIDHILTGIALQHRTRYGTVKTQFLIASATLPEEIRNFVTNVVPDVTVVESGSVSPASLSHQWIVAPLHRRTETLVNILNKNSGKKSIVFVQRVDIAEGLLEVLEDEGFYVNMITGNMSERKRAVVFEQFNSSQYDIIIATDIISRGIDIPDCDLVVQIQPAPDLDMYLHRAGRAGRVGRFGQSIVIVSDSHVKDRELIKEVRKVVDVDVSDASMFLPEQESGVTSVLENSLHHTSADDELSFSIDILMTESLRFYQKMVSELQLRPVNTTQVHAKRLFCLWFSSPVEAWAAQTAIKEHFRGNSFPAPEIGMFRHRTGQKSVLDWNGYFMKMRRQYQEDRQERYKNLVKKQMGQRRIRRGRRKWKPVINSI